MGKIMAQKARFHKFKRITGRGHMELCYPANTQHDIKNAFENDDVKIKFIESNIWKLVHVLPENIGSAFFFTDDGLEFRQGDFGFDYLKVQFQEEYDAVIKDSIPDNDY